MRSDEVSFESPEMGSVLPNDSSSLLNSLECSSTARDAIFRMRGDQLPGNVTGLRVGDMVSNYFCILTSNVYLVGDAGIISDPAARQFCRGPPTFGNSNQQHQSTLHPEISSGSAHSSRYITTMIQPVAGGKSDIEVDCCRTACWAGAHGGEAQWLQP